MSKHKACQQLRLDPSRKTIFIMGGSQGYIFVNNAIKAAILAAPSAIPHLQIIHQTGAADSSDWVHWYKQRGITASILLSSRYITPLSGS